ncbi:MAG: hypothetical protein D6785_15740, partial [Planctomycetota bacterium]
MEVLDRKMKEKKSDEKVLLLVGDLGEIANNSVGLMDSLIAKISEYTSLGLIPIFYTLRPSYDVITSQIQEIAPYRLAMPLSTKVESSILLGHGGAEKLLEGEALVVDPHWNHPIPILLPQCPLSEKEQFYHSFESDYSKASRKAS